MPPWAYQIFNSQNTKTPFLVNVSHENSQKNISDEFFEFDCGDR